jgi:hypothetical protein
LTKILLSELKKSKNDDELIEIVEKFILKADEFLIKVFEK